MANWLPSTYIAIVTYEGIRADNESLNLHLNFTIDSMHGYPKDIMSK